MASLEYILIIYSPHEKGMVLWNIVFPSGNRHGKRKKRCTKKDTMSVKISFRHYRNYITWTRVKVPVVCGDFIWFIFFGLFYLFTIIVNWHKVNFSQSLRGASALRVLVSLLHHANRNTHFVWKDKQRKNLIANSRTKSVSTVTYRILFKGTGAVSLGFLRLLLRKSSFTTITSINPTAAQIMPIIT